MPLLKGINYNSAAVYRLLTWVKLMRDCHLRFDIARSYIREGDDILDVCCGDGGIIKFLPERCTYTGLDASDTFIKKLSNADAHVIKQDINTEFRPPKAHYDLAVMVIALCHFRKSRAAELLGLLKTTASRVIIVEETCRKPGHNGSIARRSMNYLSRTAYAPYLNIMQTDDFKNLLDEQGYRFKQFNGRYCIGTHGYE